MSPKASPQLTCPSPPACPLRQAQHEALGLMASGMPPISAATIAPSLMPGGRENPTESQLVNPMAAMANPKFMHHLMHPAQMHAIMAQMPYAGLAGLPGGLPAGLAAGLPAGLNGCLPHALAAGPPGLLGLPAGFAAGLPAGLPAGLAARFPSLPAGLPAGLPTSLPTSIAGLSASLAPTVDPPAAAELMPNDSGDLAKSLPQQVYFQAMEQAAKACRAY